MYNNQRKKQIKISLIPIIIILIIIAIIVQAILSCNNISMTSIIAGRDIAKNKATEEIDQIDWIEVINAPYWDGSITYSNPVTIENNGKTVQMQGNYNCAGSNLIYYIPEEKQQQSFCFNYDIDFGDSFNSAGLLIGVKKVDNTLQGYMISFNHDGWHPSIYQCKPEFSWFTECGDKTGAIWKFSFPILEYNSFNEMIELNSDKWHNGDYSYGIQKTLVQVFDLPNYSTPTFLQNAHSSGIMQITSTPNQIIILCEGVSNEDSSEAEYFNTTIDISPDDELGNGFGFFSTHYIHGCNRYGKFEINIFNAYSEDIEPHNLYIDPNGGTWNDSSEVSTLEGEYGDEVEIPLPTRPGYNFAGWTQTGNSGSMSSLTEDAIYTFGEDAETDDTLIAQWTKIEVEKAYNIDTGEVRRKWRYNRTSKLRNRK